MSDSQRTGPGLWETALLLERADRLPEAEETLRNGIPHIAFAAQIAELYAHRMHRLRALGDHARANDAREAARRWIHNYASMATSGSEGGALSYERDRFLAELGDDPNA